MSEYCPNKCFDSKYCLLSLPEVELGLYHLCNSVSLIHSVISAVAITRLLKSCLSRSGCFVAHELSPPERRKTHSVWDKDIQNPGTKDQQGLMNCSKKKPKTAKQSGMEQTGEAEGVCLCPLCVCVRVYFARVSWPCFSERPPHSWALYSCADA